MNEINYAARAAENRQRFIDIFKITYRIFKRCVGI